MVLVSSAITDKEILYNLWQHQLTIHKHKIKTSETLKEKDTALS